MKLNAETADAFQPDGNVMENQIAMTQEMKPLRFVV